MEPQEIPDESKITPEMIRQGVDAVLRDMDNQLTASRLTPTTEAERETIRNDLSRASLVAAIATPIRIRDRAVSRVDFGMDRSFANSPLYVSRMASNLIRDHREGVIRSEERNSYFVESTRYVARSVAGWMYIHLVAGLIPRIHATITDDRFFLRDFVPPAIWERDDVAAMHQAYRDTATYLSYRGQREEVWRLAVRLARALYDANTPEYRPGLLARLHGSEMDWRNVLRQWFGSGPPEITLDAALAAFEAAVGAEEEQRIGAGSRSSREAVDRNQRAGGQLSPACDFWTYEELEHFARWFLRSATVEQLCAIVRTEKPLFELLGPVDIDEPCEEIERDELITVVERGVRASPKRGLCQLLARYSAPPAPVRWADQRWHNVDAREAYLPPEVVAQLLAESSIEGEQFVFEEVEGEGSGASRLLRRNNEAVWTPIQDAGRIRGFVAWDLYRQLFRPDEDASEYRLYLEVNRRQLSPSDPPRLLLTDIHLESPPYPMARWVAVVVLRGLLLVSLVGTNQRLTKAGEDIVAEEVEGQVLPPQQLALMPGDALVVALNEDVSVDGATTPFDIDAFYDLLVMRAAEEGTTWLEYSL